MALIALNTKVERLLMVVSGSAANAGIAITMHIAAVVAIVR